MLLLLPYSLLGLANLFHLKHGATVRSARRTSENTYLLGTRVNKLPAYLVGAVSALVSAPRCTLPDALLLRTWSTHAAWSAVVTTISIPLSPTTVVLGVSVHALALRLVEVENLKSPVFLRAFGQKSAEPEFGRFCRFARMPARRR